MAETDYYKMLGVNKSATKDEIKKAYRKLAMKYHPDHTKGDKAAEDQFKKISEAYAVLSDDEKRRQYDTYGAAGFQQRYSQEDIFRGFDLNDILKEFGFGGGGWSRGGRFSFGGGGPFGAQQAPPRGSNLEYELPLTLREMASGTQKAVSFQHQGKAENLTVKIPKGFIEGKKLRLAGKGEASPYGGPAGDLFIKAKALPDPLFHAKEHDLFIERTVRLTEAVLGTQISVPTIDGKTLNLKIPAGTKHKTKMRLSGKGLPKMKSGGKGDLFVIINIEMPEKLSKEQKKLFEQLAQTGL